MAARHLGGDELRSTSGVEAARTGGRDPPQRRFELALAERRNRSRGRAEVSEGSWCARGVRRRSGHAPRPARASTRKPSWRIAQRGREIRAPGEAAEAAVQLPTGPRDRPRHRPRRPAPIVLASGMTCPARIEVHAGGRAGPGRTRGSRGSRALPLMRHGGKAPTAQVAGFRIGHSEGEGDRYPPRRSRWPPAARISAAVSAP